MFGAAPTDSKPEGTTMPDIETPPATPAEMLQSVFGFPAFRQGQEAAVIKLLDGRSVLAIFPTGAGKSMCYQLPALLLDGVTLVISPLIALMKDQIDFLVSKGVAAARLDSSLPLDEWRQIMSDLNGGRLKLLYVAPERLANERFLQTLKRLNIAMLAVDEAHCISEWGHNFRPDYMKIARLARELNVGRVLALTATATPSVARDIAAAFDIAADDVVQTGFYRPNLSMRIAPTRPAQRDALLLEHIGVRPRGPTIVYVTLQKTAEDVARLLAARALPAKAYHAGMDAEARHAVQDWFMASADALVVATIAFGMGIDKRDIRYVYHYNLPKSLENYAQEIGRAGRDGEPSVCEILACADDVTTLENFTFGDTPTPEAVAGLLHHLLDSSTQSRPTPGAERSDAPDPSGGDFFDISTYDLSGEYDVRPLVIETLLTYLELDGVIASTGAFYSEYKFQPTKSSRDMLAPFDARRQAFLRKMLSRAERGKTWFKLNLDAAAHATGEPREKIVAALNYLEERGDLTLQVAGARKGYRHVGRDASPVALAKEMVTRFLDRERRDVERMRSVIDFANGDGCLTRRLLAYFGETRDADCGRCGWCAGERPGPMPEPRRRELTDRDAAAAASLRREHPAALGSPRQMARFLCGIGSPGLTRAKLAKHSAFGSWAAVPFRDALAFLERPSSGVD